jgi:ABC-type sulfate transport system permease component
LVSWSAFSGTARCSASWLKTVGLTEEDTRKANMVKVFGISFVLQFMMAWCLTMFFGPDITTATGTLFGFLAGMPWVAAAIAINALFEQTSWQYILINGGYWTVTFTLMGVVLGTWHG